MDFWPLVVDFLSVYGIFLGIYFVMGCVLTYCNQRFMAARRIQLDRTPDPRLSRRDIIQSVRSLAQIALFFTIGCGFRAAGFGPRPYETSWTSFLLCLPVSMILFDAWFYWGHRLLHTKLLYKFIHQWHHESITPTPWSNNSDKFLDNLFLQSYWMFAPLFLPAPTLVFLVHKIYDHVTGIIGHSGYEYNPSSSRTSLFPAVTHHDQHHSHQKYNFGSTFVVWDVLMGTLHPEYYARMERYSAAARTKV